MGLWAATTLGTPYRDRSSGETLLASYLPILFMLLLAGAFAVVTITLARIISPKDPTYQKSMPYESGITEIDPMVERFPVRFYLVAMLFVIFDVEVILF